MKFRNLYLFLYFILLAQGCANNNQTALTEQAREHNQQFADAKNLTLASVFGNNMVIQQDRTVEFWGTDSPGQKVTVNTSWGSESSAITNKEGHWQVSVPTPLADHVAHHISFTGSGTQYLNNVLLGEVWFASGQSNMGMPLSGKLNQPVNGSNEVILNAHNDYIRLFDNKQVYSDAPLNKAEGMWKQATPNSVKSFSAVAYFFAKKIQSILNVPVGIIHSSWGGTPVEAWIDEPTLKQYPNYKFWNALKKDKPFRQTSTLFNGMINPFLGLQIKGAIWYQGESNRPRPKEYQTLFPAMVKSWRAQWNSGEFPFYYVQIAPFGTKPNQGAYLRESQLLSMDNIPSSGMAVTLDIGNCSQIHPPEKRIVGNRLAYWALAEQYSIDVAYKGPTFSHLDVKKQGRVQVYFKDAERGITSYSKPITEFEIAGEDRVFHPAEAKIMFRKPAVNVWSNKVKKPVAIRYGFKDCPTGELFSVEGLPVSSFRTDHWKANKQ